MSKQFLYGMEMDLYSLKTWMVVLMDLGTILYGFPYTWGSKGILIFWT